MMRYRPYRQCATRTYVPFQRVCGIPFGGLHVATGFSLHSKVPMVYVHPAKEHNGSRVFVEGTYVRVWRQRVRGRFASS